jgi:hypothetical protein
MKLLDWIIDTYFPERYVTRADFNEVQRRFNASLTNELRMRRELAQMCDSYWTLVGPEVERISEGMRVLVLNKPMEQVKTYRAELDITDEELYEVGYPSLERRVIEVLMNRMARIITATKAKVWAPK